MKTYIFGHQSPDTDTICSALALAYIENQTGNEAVAMRLGELNKETMYALEYFGVEAPAYLEAVSAEQPVILVDHNEYPQSVSGIEQATIMGIYDHHKVGGFQTKDPLYVRIEPVGCTATILYKLAQERGIELPKAIAGLMLSAIISDSLLFKSPTCTKEDVEVAKKLEQIAGVNAEMYGMEMLKCGADLSDKTARELLYIDSKPFTMGKYQVQVAQVNTVDLQTIQARKAEIITALEKEVTEEKKDLFLFVATDILNSNSLAYVAGTADFIVEKAFDVVLEEQEALLPGVVSRKKQVVPVMTKVAEM
ncbi:MAG: manganese-dependent inorganic pyrophosphatase [Culicoidibacterales bacterium]